MMENIDCVLIKGKCWYPSWHDASVYSFTVLPLALIERSWEMMEMPFSLQMQIYKENVHDEWD